MAAPFSIRLASLSDVESIVQLIPLSVRALQAQHYTAAQMEGALGTVFAVDTQLIRDGTYYVAEIDRQLIGCGGWSRRQTLFGGDGLKAGVDPALDPNIDAARIRAFFIRPGWERHGIGSELMRRCEAAAREAGFTRIEIMATLVGALLYATFGYEIAESLDLPLGNGEFLSVVKMKKLQHDSSAARLITE